MIKQEKSQRPASQKAAFTAKQQQQAAKETRNDKAKNKHTSALSKHVAPVILRPNIIPLNLHETKRCDLGVTRTYGSLSNRVMEANCCRLYIRSQPDTYRKKGVGRFNKAPFGIYRDLPRPTSARGLDLSLRRHNLRF